MNQLSSDFSPIRAEVFVLYILYCFIRVYAYT